MLVRMWPRLHPPVGSGALLERRIVSRIPDDIIESVRQAVDITDLVGRYVGLKRSGRSFKGCCPFHDEKTPSFHVWPETSTWRCFGCGKGGNIFGFLMEREGLAFPEAIRQLAKDVGIEIEAQSPQARARADHLQRLRDLHEWACAHFEAALRGPRGEPARAYFTRRSITSETAGSFRLGYAPPGWDNLLRAAAESEWSEDELVEGGLVIRREEEGGRKKLYDRFRDRVVFPIADAQGRVIAFGARTLGDDEPKYLNSSDTPIYTKGQHLYALHHAKQGMMKTGEGAVMEGYTDVIMAHQAGWPVAVAGLGTALTHEQAQKLSRYVKKLWLVYDGDKAGRRAAEKAIPEFLPEDLETRVALLAPGKDPADLVVEGGIEALKDALAEAPDAFEHLVATSAAQYDATTVPGKAAATEAVLESLVAVRDPIRRALYVRRTSDAFGVPEAVVVERLADLVRRREQREAARRDRAAGAASSSGARGASRGGGRSRGRSSGSSRSSRDQHGDEPPLEAYAGAMGGADADGGYAPAHPADFDAPAAGGAARRGARASGGSAPPRAVALSQVERQFMEAVLGCPSVLADVPEAGTELLAHPEAAELLSHLLAAWDESGGTLEDGARAVATIEAPELQALAADLLASGAGKNFADQGRDCLRILEDSWRSRNAHRRVSAAAGDKDAEIDALQALIALEAARHARKKS